jgi:hypothetical protein
MSRSGIRGGSFMSAGPDDVDADAILVAIRD